MLETVYLGLATRPKLTSLTIRFPSTRYPRPTTAIPAFPHLQSLKVTDIDPLCYPDDLSTCLAESRKLKELKLHWSPRMREAHEPSVILTDPFRKAIAAQRPLKLKSISFQNLFAQQTEEFVQAIDVANVENVTLLNCAGEDDDSGGGEALSFFDQSWKPPKDVSKVKSLRHDRINTIAGETLGRMRGLEKLYMVNARPGRQTTNGYAGGPSPISNSSGGPSPIEQQTPSTSNSSSHNPSTQFSGGENTLRDLYLENLMSNHGHSLKHLLLPSRWPLTSERFAHLVRACPNLTQLGMALEFDSLEAVRLLLPFLKKLYAVRAMVPTVRDAKVREKSLAEIVEVDDAIHEEKMGDVLAGEAYSRLRWVGMGWKVWEVGGTYEVERVSEHGERVKGKRRRVRRVGPELCQHIEIWGMDSPDIL